MKNGWASMTCVAQLSWRQAAGRFGFRDSTFAPAKFYASIWKDDMKKGYWVVAYRSISDESAPKAYAELAVPALESFGGRFLTKRSSKVQPHEAGLQQGTVVVEFESYERALAA
jgi:uncharacterized protein (DUF1330 family)